MKEMESASRAFGEVWGGTTRAGDAMWAVWMDPSTAYVRGEGVGHPNVARCRVTAKYSASIFYPLNTYPILYNNRQHTTVLSIQTTNQSISLSLSLVHPSQPTIGGTKRKESEDTNTYQRAPTTPKQTKYNKQPYYCAELQTTHQGIHTYKPTNHKRPFARTQTRGIENGYTNMELL